MQASTAHVQPHAGSHPYRQVTTSGYTYDAAGNMTNDGVNSYTYDAEGNVTQVSGGQTATYTYDALNRRVRIDSPASSLEFIFDPQGRHTSQWNVSSQSEQEAWTYWGNAPLSYYYVSTPTTQFDHQDWLGTERARTGVTGGVVGTYTSFPFGDGYSNTGNDLNSDHFATLDQDNSANDHAQFREYSNMAGRWFSPDPYQGSYDPSNPQSFNRYAYVLNNPVSAVDPLGLFGVKCQLVYVPDWVKVPNDNGDGGHWVDFGGTQLQCAWDGSGAGGAGSGGNANGGSGGCTTCHVKNYKPRKSCDVDKCTPQEKAQWCHDAKEMADLGATLTGSQGVGPYVTGVVGFAATVAKWDRLAGPLAVVGLAQGLAGYTVNYVNQVCSQ